MPTEVEGKVSELRELREVIVKLTNAVEAHTIDIQTLGDEVHRLSDRMNFIRPTERLSSNMRRDDSERTADQLVQDLGEFLSRKYRE